MMYKPPEKILSYMNKVEQWTYFDTEDAKFKLRDDAPSEIVEMYKQIIEDRRKNTFT